MRSSHSWRESVRDAFTCLLCCHVYLYFCHKRTKANMCLDPPLPRSPSPARRRQLFLLTMCISKIWSQIYFLSYQKGNLIFQTAHDVLSAGHCSGTLLVYAAQSDVTPCSNIREVLEVLMRLKDNFLSLYKYINDFLSISCLDEVVTER